MVSEDRTGSSGNHLLAHELVFVRVADDVQGEIDVQLRPMKMVAVGEFDLRDLADTGVSEPGELLKGQEVLGPVRQNPEAVLRDVRHLTAGSALPTL